jgi:hypothetical protein
MLRTSEDLFGLDHLAYAGQDGLAPFGDDVFTASGNVAKPGKPPRISVKGVPKHGCTGGFRARVRIRAGRLSSVSVRLDGKGLYGKARKRFSVRVRPATMRHGVHRLRIRAVAASGRSARHVNHFRTCAR